MSIIIYDNQKRYGYQTYPVGTQYVCKLRNFVPKKRSRRRISTIREKLKETTNLYVSNILKVLTFDSNKTYHHWAQIVPTVANLNAWLYSLS